MNGICHTDSGPSRIRHEARLSALIDFHRARLDACPADQRIATALRIVLLHAGRRLPARGLAVLERLALTHGQSDAFVKFSAHLAAGGNSVCSTAGGPIFGWRL